MAIISLAYRISNLAYGDERKNQTLNMKLRSHLIILVVAALLPVLIFAGVMIVVFGRQQQRFAENGLLDTARALSLAVDRELTAWSHTLETLASSEHLDSGDLKKFYSQAQRVLETRQDWDTIVLVELPKRQVLNLKRPFGSPLPDVQNSAQLTGVVETRRPVVSDLFSGQVLGRHLVGIAVPVIRAGKVRYVLMSAVSPASLSRLLLQQKLSDEWEAGVIDRNKIIIARTRNIEEFLGKPTGQLLAAKSAESQEAVWRGVMQEGPEVYSALRRSELSGWTVVVGINATVLDSPMRHTLLSVIGGGFALLLVGVVVATVFGRRIANSISSLSNAAAALARSQMPQTTTSHIVEVNNVARVIEDAATERQHAEESIRRQSRLLDLYFKYSLNPVVFLDRDFNFIRVNEAYARSCQRDVSEFPGHNHFEFYPSDAKVIFEEVVKTKKPFQTFTHPFVFPDHPEWGVTYWDWTLVPILDTAGEVELLVFSLNDVTERKRAEEQLRRSLKQMGLLQEINRAVSSSLDLQVVLKLLLERVDLLLPYSATSVMLTNRESGELEPIACRNPDETEWRAHWEAGGGLAKIVLETQSPLAIKNVSTDPRVANRDFIAKHGFVSYLGLPLIAHDTALGFIGFNTKAEHEFSSHEIKFLSTLADQTAIAIHNSQLYEQIRKQSQGLLVYRNQLRALTVKMIGSKEEEAKRIARELHDEAGQLLASVYIVLDDIAREVEPPAKERIQKVIGMLDQIEEQLRSLAHQLPPTILDDLGLLPAIQSLAQRFSKRTGMDIALDEVPKQRLPPAIETALYRTVQEALNNVTKHAQATTVRVQIQQEDGIVRCLVLDNGIGFDAPTVLSRTGAESLGLVGIRERVEILKGKLQIQSAPGQGTQLCVTIPLEE